MARSGLIRQQSRSSYSSAHVTWQEFFAAEDFDYKHVGEALLGHVGDPWWREVILLDVGLQPDATDLLRRLKDHDLLLAAAALADALDPETPQFRALASEIIVRLKQMVETDPDRRQEAADALAAVGRWGATEYLVERARAQGRPQVSLAAVLALDQAGDRGELARLCEPLGPLLQLLTGHLDKVDGAVDARILALLDRLGLPLVPVAAGEFVMGREGRDLFSDERPQRRLTLEAYWIGKYPVTNALYRRFRAETGDSSVRSPETGKDDHPVVNVSWRDALAFCRWVGVQLPSEAEWEKAARGTDGRRYPWSNEWQVGRCNVGTAGTSPVGAYTGDRSPYGCFDMAGNVEEWTRSLYRPYPYAATDGRESLEAADARVVRGGAFFNLRRLVGASSSRPGEALFNAGTLAQAARRYWYLPSPGGRRFDRVGFRVVVSPPFCANRVRYSPWVKYCRGRRKKAGDGGLTGVDSAAPRTSLDALHGVPPARAQVRRSAAPTIASP